MAADGRTGQRRVVIAGQGGGSHTAFTAGVLKRLLGARELAGYQVSGLSGTSGGAVCALLAWYALLEDDPVGAGRLLERFWADNSARGPVEIGSGTPSRPRSPRSPTAATNCPATCRCTRSWPSSLRLGPLPPDP